MLYGRADFGSRFIASVYFSMAAGYLPALKSSLPSARAWLGVGLWLGG